MKVACRELPMCLRSHLKLSPYIFDRGPHSLKVSAEVSNRGENTIIGGNVNNGGTIVPGLDLRKFETVG